MTLGCNINVLINLDITELLFYKLPGCCFIDSPGSHVNGQTRLERHMAGYESSSTMMSSELDTTSFCDSDEDDTMSRYTVSNWKK